MDEDEYCVAVRYIAGKVARHVRDTRKIVHTRMLMGLYGQPIGHERLK